MANTNYATDGLIGAKLDNVETTANHKLGTTIRAKSGALFMYCQASATISQYDTAVIDSSFQARAITSALTTEGMSLGWPQVAVAASEYFWAGLEGRTIKIRVASSCAANAPLYTTATAGVLDDAAANNLIEGVRIVTTAASTTALTGTDAYVVFPRIGASV